MDKIPKGFKIPTIEEIEEELPLDYRKLRHLRPTTEERNLFRRRLRKKLGAPPEASIHDCNQMFKFVLAMLFHPDHHTDKPMAFQDKAIALFKECNEALDEIKG